MNKENETKKENLGENIYSGVASFGVFMALIGAVIATLIGLVFFIGGLIGLKKYKPLDKISATVKTINGDPLQINCQKIIDGQNQTYSCSVDISYNYLGQNMNRSVNYSGNKSFYKGQIIDIWVNPSEPTDITLSQPLQKWHFLLFIFLGILIPGLAWFWYWITKKWKFAAAVSGIDSAASIIFR